MRKSRRNQNTITAHPGEVLRTEFLEPMGISAYQLAKALHFPGVYEIVREQRAISADVALRLGKYFGMTPQFWMNLQSDYDLRCAAASAALGKIKPRTADELLNATEAAKVRKGEAQLRAGQSRPWPAVKSKFGR